MSAIEQLNAAILSSPVLLVERQQAVANSLDSSRRRERIPAAVQTEPGLKTNATDLLRLRRMGADPAQTEDYFARVCAVMRQ